MKKFIMFVVLMLGTACMVLIAGVRFSTPVALTVLILAVSADFLLTLLGLRKGGKEGNPVIAFLLKKIGIVGTFGLMACIWTVFIVFRWLPSTEGIQTAVACAYWLVPVNNLLMLRKYCKVIKSRKNHAVQKG